MKYARSSQPSKKDNRPLDRPVCPEAADGISRQYLGPARPPDLKHLERPRQRKGRENEDQLTEFDTHIEEEQCGRKLRLRHPCRGETARKTKPVQQPEQESNDPGKADRQARLTLPGTDDLRPKEEDAERDA